MYHIFEVRTFRCVRTPREELTRSMKTVIQRSAQNVFGNTPLTVVFDYIFKNQDFLNDLRIRFRITTSPLEELSFLKAEQSAFWPVYRLISFYVSNNSLSQQLFISIVFEEFSGYDLYGMSYYIYSNFQNFIADISFFAYTSSKDVCFVKNTA